MQKTTLSDLNVDCVSVLCSFLDINTDTYVLDLFSLQGKETERVLNYWKRHSDYTVEEKKDRKEWRRNGELHRDDYLPAIIHNDGTREWWKIGKRHREGDLPAVIWEDGGNEWWKNGKLHREGDLPAIEWSNGKKEWWKNDERHREGDLPAVISVDGHKEWWKHGKIYRQVH